MIEGVTIRRDEPMSRHSPWRCGGPSDAWIVVHRRDAVPEVLAHCRSEGWKTTLLGAGSRCVFRDGGLAGAILRLGTGFTTVVDEGEALRFGAAVPLSVVGARLELPGLLRAPGSLGASLMHDVGWDGRVAEVAYIHRNKERRTDLATMREKSGLVIVVEAVVRKEGPVPPGPDFPLAWYLSADGGDAGSTILEADLGDTRLRHVCVPREEPAMIVNLGGGRAKDMALLQKSTIERAHRVRGEELDNRMTWLGRAS